MKHITIILAALALLSACSNEKADLKSPCVGGAGSPCEHRPVNDWWMKGQG